ncbi:hypothetical protein PAXRUDRAFT_433863 [Paxillus rubicundulus Ve08.2h10]|uniref:Uncharacterized protein n=1 Tax=Paxillus rubicundulus Ve08.2h10 TaxID=930991 RepID=A0A0D0ECR2_9AGAM|nr:hypothetical protein PAXRUDRAFT_433863 [Paxillus rubicundulus Ve08.2h10]
MPFTSDEPPTYTAGNFRLSSAMIISPISPPHILQTSFTSDESSHINSELLLKLRHGCFSGESEPITHTVTSQIISHMHIDPLLRG